MKKINIFLIIIVALMGSVASAKKFENGQLSLDLPEGWTCSSNFNSWSCFKEHKYQKANSIIAIAMHPKGISDSLEKYLSVLKKPFRPNNKNKTRRYVVKKNKINNQVWADSTHYNSELNNFVTRYLATVNDDVAIVVSFSGHKDQIKQLNPMFIKSIESLKLKVNQVDKKSEDLSYQIYGPELNKPVTEVASLEKNSENSNRNLKLILGLLSFLSLLAGFILYKRTRD